MSASILSMLTLAAHIGGLPTRASFQTPVDVGEVGDQTYTVVWIDGDADLTGIFDFFYQEPNNPPNAQPGSAWFFGTPMAEAQDILITDLANQFAWDTSGVPSGSYFVYEVTEDLDMGIDPAVSMNPMPVTIQHASDPLWPAVRAIEPDGNADTVDSLFAVKWRGSGAGTLTASVSYGIPMPNGVPDPLSLPILVASGLPMVEESPGIYTGCYEWDVSAMSEGFYWVLVEVEDEGARTHRAYAKGMVIVNHAAGSPDAGQSCDAAADAGPTPDAGRITVDDPVCGCAVNYGSKGPLPWPAALFIGLALLFGLRGRRA